MILSGLQIITIQKKLGITFNLLLLSFVLIFVLTGCSLHWLVGDGRGDWTQELINGYAILKINSNKIMIGHKDSLDSPGWSDVIPNYYITAYQQKTPFIFLTGIQTKHSIASAEELNSNPSIFYLVNSETEIIAGPFSSLDDLKTYCSDFNLVVPDTWEITANCGAGIHIQNK